MWSDMVVFRFLQVAWQFQTPIHIPAMKQGLILEWKADKNTYLYDIDVRNPFAKSILQKKNWRAERLYKLV
jgi:hypothetical protein